MGKRLRGRRRQLLVAAVLVSTVSVVLSGGAVQAEVRAEQTRAEESFDGPPPDGFRSWDELWEVQRALNAAADQLAEKAEGEPGFTGIEAATLDRELRLHWYGIPPEPVQELVDHLRRDVPVSVHRARHPLRDLLVEQERIAAVPGVSAVSPFTDGSGLLIAYYGSEEQARSHPAIRDSAIQLTIEPYEQVEFLSCTGRQDDCEPYRAGATMTTPAGGWCTTGFVLKFHDWSSFPTTEWYRMLAAGHCVQEGDLMVDGGGDPLGTVVDVSEEADLALIEPYGSNSLGPWMYDGWWQASFQHLKPVVGGQPSYSGNVVYHSGSATGNLGPVMVTQVNVLIFGTIVTHKAVKIPYYSYYSYLYVAGNGDSGGPVFTYHFQQQDVNAVGMLTAGSKTAFCSGQIPSTKCYQVVYYVDLATVFDHYAPPGGGWVGAATIDDWPW
jgi:hypothetical protein